MEKLVFTLAVILLGLLQVQAQNPYAALGIEEQVLHYDDAHEEVFGNDTFKTIGYAIYDRVNGLTTLFDLSDSLVAIQKIDPSKMARFLSVDPIAREYPWYTPYQFAGTMPIKAIDLDGLEPWGNPSDWKIHKDFGDHYNLGKTLTRVSDNITEGYYWVLHGQHGNSVSYNWYNYKTQSYESFIPDGYIEATGNGAPILPSNEQSQWDNNTFGNYSEGLTKFANHSEGFMLLTTTVVSGGGSGALALRGITWGGAGSAIADITNQWISKRDPLQINVTSVASSLVMRNAFGSAFIGSAGEVRINDILNNQYPNTIFGDKQSGTMMTETMFGGMSNYLGSGIAKAAVEGGKVQSGLGEMFFDILSNTTTGLPATKAGDAIINAELKQ